ncbi:hypothetical protein Tco_1271021 [Tanacetum coccineum]
MESQFPVLAAWPRITKRTSFYGCFEIRFSTTGMVLSIRRTRFTPTSLEMCICLKDHLDAAGRIQHISSLEDGLEYEEQLHGVEVETGEAYSIFDEGIALDEATSEARFSEAEEEDVNLEQALN